MIFWSHFASTYFYENHILQEYTGIYFYEFHVVKNFFDHLSLDGTEAHRSNIIL